MGPAQRFDRARQLAGKRVTVRIDHGVTRTGILASCDPDGTVGLRGDDGEVLYHWPMLGIGEAPALEPQARACGQPDDGAPMCPCGEPLAGGDCPGAWRGCDWQHDDPGLEAGA